MKLTIKQKKTLKKTGYLILADLHEVLKGVAITIVGLIIAKFLGL